MAARPHALAFLKSARQGVARLLRPRSSSSMLADLSREHFRDLMLDLLPKDPADASHNGLARRIRNAPDIHALWQLRMNLVATLAQLHGEGRARELVLELSQECDASLPRGLATRASPLS